MPCNRPLAGYLGPGGWSAHPPRGEHSPLTVPCGRCLGCRIDKARWWTVRVAHEAQMHEHSCFVTLTYSDEALPDPPSVSRREFQLFIKRLRKSLGSDRIRFFGCGEYGGQAGRPHYHAILFGIDFASDRIPWKPSPAGLMEYRSPRLEKAWGHGHCTLSDITPQTGGYVARYTMKKTATNRERLNAQTGEVYYVDEEFLAMSRRPGIGSTWFDKFKSELFPNDFCIINGTKMPIPPYYWDKINKATNMYQPDGVGYRDDFDMKEALFIEGVKAERLHKITRLQQSGELEPDRLSVKEEIHRLRAEASTRNLGET